MKIAVIGQGWLAAEVFRSISIFKGVTIVAVSPEKPEDRFAILAKQRGYLPKNIEKLPACDCILAAHCHKYIGASVRNKTRHGVIAYHPSLLPRHRGRDAVHWTIAMGDPIAGGTTYVMDEGADTGNIVNQAWCHVLPTDTPQTLWRRSLGPMGVRLLMEAVVSLQKDGRLETTPQPEQFATWEPALKRASLRQSSGK